MRERKDFSQEQLDELFAQAEEAMKLVGATDVSTKSVPSTKQGKFKAECDKGCKDCQPNILCPTSNVTRSRTKTVFVDLEPTPIQEIKDFSSNR